MSPQTHAGIDYSKVDEILSAFEYKKSNLIAILQKVQEVFRFLPLDVMTYIGTKIEGLSPATVYGVATFYAQFSLEPKGKYEIKVKGGLCVGSPPVFTPGPNTIVTYNHNQTLNGIGGHGGPSCGEGDENNITVDIIDSVIQMAEIDTSKNRYSNYYERRRRGQIV